MDELHEPWDPAGAAGTGWPPMPGPTTGPTTGPTPAPWPIAMPITPLPRTLTHPAPIVSPLRRRAKRWGVPAVLGVAALAALLSTCGPGGPDPQGATLVRATPSPGGPASASPSASGSASASGSVSAVQHLRTLGGSPSPGPDASAVASEAATSARRGGSRSPAARRHTDPPSPRSNGGGSAPGNGSQDTAGGGSAPSADQPLAPELAGAGMCGAAERYGQWAAGSGQGSLCREVYGG